MAYVFTKHPTAVLSRCTSTSGGAWPLPGLPPWPRVTVARDEDDDIAQIHRASQVSMFFDWSLKR
jgi:hypothetical protein